jgi:hypothetical protein
MGISEPPCYTKITFLLKILLKNTERTYLLGTCSAVKTCKVTVFMHGTEFSRSTRVYTLLTKLQSTSHDSSQSGRTL